MARRLYRHVPVVCALSLLAANGPIRAENHTAHLQEVMAGANGDSAVQFIIIALEGSGPQLWGPQPGETQSRAQLAFFDATGREIGRFNFPSDPQEGGTSNVLIATQELAEMAGAPTPDIMIPALLSPISGKVCFRANPSNPVFLRNDCLSYGSFTGNTETNEHGVPAGSPAPALSVVGTHSLRRALNTGTNADYAVATPTPRNTAGASLTIPVAPAVVQGETLFTKEAFMGNGRTCATCHPTEQNFRLTPADVQSRFTDIATTFDPLFVSENNPSSFDSGFDFNLNTLLVTGTTPSDTDTPCTGELRGIVTSAGGGRAKVLARTGATSYLVYGGRNSRLAGTVTDGTCSATVSSVVPGTLGDIPGNGASGLEDPQRMRTSVVEPFAQGRALILENIDGFEHPPVFRKSPHLLNMRHTAPFGLSGEFTDLQLFTSRAVQQHFPRTLTRNGSGANPDFRFPTPDELAALEAFLLAQEFPSGDAANKFDLDHFTLTSAQQRGRTAFFGSAKCSQCHGGTVLAATTVSIEGKGIGINAAFNTGVASRTINGSDGDNLPCEPGIGVCDTREFSTPQLFNLKNLVPFFHDASAATLHEAVSFYSSTAFANSPAGLAIGGISMSAETVDDITAFLGGLGFGISGIMPAIGHTSGGTTVTLSGTNFEEEATVSLGGIMAADVTRMDRNTIIATTPAHAEGLVDVVVSNPGEDALTLTNGYTFTTAEAPTVTSIVPTSGLTAGGAAVTITGNNFVGGTGLVVYVGLPTTNATVLNATTITATTVPHDAGTADVVVTTPDSQNGSLIEGFTYRAPVFTDDPLTPGTAVKAAHLTELRTRTNALRIRCGLATFDFTDATLTALAIIATAAHLTEIRAALRQAYDACQQPTPDYTDATLVPGTTRIKAIHITELRAAIIALE